MIHLAKAADIARDAVVVLPHPNSAHDYEVWYKEEDYTKRISCCTMPRGVAEDYAAKMRDFVAHLIDMGRLEGHFKANKL